MKCARCATDLPGHAQFCMKCGMPVAVAPPAATAATAHPFGTGPVVVRGASDRSGLSRAAMIGMALLVCALVACGGYLGVRSLLNRSGAVPGGSNVVTAAGRVPEGSGLLNASGRIGGAGRLTDATGQTGPAPIDTTDINDYLKFLREIEAQRLTMQRREMADLMVLAQTVTAGNITAEMGSNEQDISSGHNATYGSIQSNISKVTDEWDALAKQFRSKPAPQSCQTLADDYYRALGKAEAASVSVMNSFSQALGAMGANDTSKVGDIVEKLKSKDGAGMGSYSKDIDDSFNEADRELGAVCDRFHLHKDFDIKPDGGSASMFGLGG